MLIDDSSRAPDPAALDDLFLKAGMSLTPYGTRIARLNGDVTETPGDILDLWQKLRIAVGIVKSKKKDGVKFKVRAAEDLYDQIRVAANDLGVLIYPGNGKGQTMVVEDGTLAGVDLTVVAQAVSDGSRLVFWGFGLGADSQDKAGGKAGTYAFKQALIQACLAGGTKEKGGIKVDDTDDTDTPIVGGVKPKTTKPKRDEVEADLRAALDSKSAEAYRAAREKLRAMRPEDILALKDLAKEAKAAAGVTD